MQATAFEVKRLLIAGKQKAAQDGQLWGCALLMARQLGEKFYTDTIAEMAQRQFQPGFPLRTLTLLYAGQHAGVFVGNTNLSNVTALQPQPVPASAVDGATQDAVEGMLEEWQENLAIMAANRTNGDERVIMHLGDCLWRHRDEICGAHICYLVANASFEPFSPSARLCLIGADHCKYPRTYASPEAIQRMEVYEFARVTGNSQFILLPFQPYKLIYALMLAEAGKINEALRYCLAVLKTLKTASHAADVCKEAAVALEERLHIHSQVSKWTLGFYTHFPVIQGGSTSIVQRFFGNIGLHKMIGPSPLKASDNAGINNRPATASSRSNVSLASSASMEPINDITRRSNMPARSISEPDFRPAQVVSPAKGTPNRGVFTSFVQRAMGFIKTPSKEAKLGDSNKFRYDETLKRWVEEGAEAQAPDLPLAPPPTANKLVSRVEENGAPISMSPERPQPTPERPQPVVSGIPPMPPSSNQYAARARQNVRSRYVDTFNKGSVTPSKTSSDSPPLFGVVPKASAKPLAPARFFVPAAAAAAAPDINSNHSVDPSSAPAFVPDTAFSNGNGPFAAAAFAQPVVQDMRNDLGPTPDHLSSGSSPAMFYSNHYPAAPSTISLLPPPALEVTPPVMVEQQQQNQHQESSIHRHHHQQSGTVGFEAASSSGVFGDDLQEVEL
ncbi:protein transport protein SEC16B homolog isoform X1 [Selaginella moellendorffii]|uniref:protein transport protein SEC16B homolog isoform X1 n=1 Tax=Selaginella moellendorffii TaxID=88036 RepID=UPI000D1C87F5|nr:protein transport protein SEC16B homolog isoform X1 [Selaginella moellendorffii]|eukprot:XP_024532336.1 protein transport protein SEC16B homolog isoform X1 [Selaginella moellendorffii]